MIAFWFKTVFLNKYTNHTGINGNEEGNDADKKSKISKARQITLSLNTRLTTSEIEKEGNRM